MEHVVDVTVRLTFDSWDVPAALSPIDAAERIMLGLKAYGEDAESFDDLKIVDVHELIQ